MLDFEISEEQKMMVQSIGRFAQEKMRQVFREADEEEKVPDDLLQSGWDFGILSSAIPLQYGGFGEYSVLTGVLAFEELAYGDLAIALNLMTPSVFAVPIMLSGTDGQKQRYLPYCCSEHPPRLTAALTEPRIQFDPRCPETVAQRENGTYYLNGVKSLVPLALEAENFLVYANEGGMTQAFVLDRHSEGLAVLEKEKLMGIHALPMFRLKLEDCPVKPEQKLGGKSGIDFDEILNHSRVALAAAAVGVARAGYEYSREYAKNRIQFGEAVARRQSIAFMLAEMAIEIDAARLLVWEAAWKLDLGLKINQEATLMKYYVDRMVMKVADSAVQILGGYGYSREFPVELWLRNARGFASFDGLAMA